MLSLLWKFDQHNHAAHISIDVKLLGTIVNIYKKKIIKKKILDKTVFVKTLLISYDQTLKLKCCQLPDHIRILVLSMSYKDILQLIVIIHFEILITSHKLTLCRRINKCLNIPCLDLEISTCGCKCLAICIHHTKLCPGYLFKSLEGIL